MQAHLTGYDNMESDNQINAYPPLFKNGKTVDEFEGIKNIFPQDADYPKHLTYKEEKDTNGKILKKYNDGVVEELNENGLLKSVYYPKEKIKCLLENGNMQFLPDPES